MRLSRFRAVLICTTACAVCVGPPIALAASPTAPHHLRSSLAGLSTARGASRNPDVGCTLDVRQHPHFSETGRRHGKSEVTWKVAVTCYWGKIVSGKFVSSGVRATVPFIHIRLALYRNGEQVGQGSKDRPAVSYLTGAVAGPCTAGAIYQGWGKGFAVLPPGVTDYRNGTQFSINQGWGDQRRIRRCS